MHPNYQDTLEFLFRQLPMFQRVGPAAFKKDLTNIRKLLTALGDPHQQFTAIHIAGTNGKGTVAHLLSAVLQTHGLKTGLYVSPHYRDFRERIKINSVYVSEEFVVEFVAQHRALFTTIQPSFFEITVAMAFAYFADQQVDVAVIETGLGGRLDSTNILSPILSVITNISYDHQQFLGETLPEIAGEKAGIIKAKTPVIIGETQPEVRSVFLAKAEAQQAPITFADQHWQVLAKETANGYTSCQILQHGELLFDEVTVALQGPHLTKNIVTTLQAITVLADLGLIRIQEANLRRALREVPKLTRFIGRWQILQQHPTILVDSAHNAGGLQPVLAAVQALEYAQLHIVLGIVRDKAPEKILTYFPTHAKYYFAKADVPRGLAADQLQQAAAEFNLLGRAYPSVAAALQAAKRQAGTEDLIFVGGSIFTVAEVV